MFGVLAVTFMLLCLFSSIVARFALSKQYYWTAYETNFNDVTLAIRLGNYYFGGGAYDLQKAMESYVLASKLDPKVEHVHYQLSRIYFVEGDLNRAESEINHELTVNPNNLRSLYIRGLIDLAQNNLLAAESDFSRFVAWAPTEWGGYNDLAFTLAKEGKYAESEAVAREGIKNALGGAQVPWLWNSVGLAELNQLKYKEAVAAFTQAQALASDLTEVQWQHAYTANDPEGATESIQTFQQSIQKNLLTAKMGGTISL